MIDNINTLIIPDIHGRTFWKDAIDTFPKKSYPKLTIVFLGDYLDPYRFENITPKQALKNFEEILKLARKDSRVHLLIGNHDLHYLLKSDTCRLDYDHYMEIKKLFEDNLDIIKVVYSKKINGKKYLFSHAGITKNWITYIKSIARNMLKKKLLDEKRNFYEKLKNVNMTKSLDMLLDSYYGLTFLHMVSGSRGGDDLYGSCIWADLEEHIYGEIPNKDIFQIFAHSLAYPSIDEPYIDYNLNFAMLDTRTAWVIDNNNNLIQYKT